MKDGILVVEDNTALAENIEELLRDEGFEVARCANTHEVGHALAQRSFDLALVDIGLSGKESGLDLLPRLRRHSALCEIILMTGNANLHTALQAIRSGVYAYLPKPFDPDELIALAKRGVAQVALKRERHALSQRLALSEAQYRGVVETVEACILAVDAQGVVSFANRFASERLAAGKPLEGRALPALSDARGRRELTQALSRAAAGEPVRDLETRHTQGQRVYTVRWTLTPLQSESLDVARMANEAKLSLPRPAVLAVGIDISDRLELERRSAASQAMAAMGTIATSLAHEIRNPLNAAQLQLELLTRRAKRAEDAALQRQLSEPAQLVRAELARLSVLLDDFLLLARPRLPVRTPCLVESLFESVITLEEPLARAAGISVTRHVAPGLTVRCDFDKLKQVLINLVRNAIDAMTERGFGQIELHAEPRSQGGVTIRVRDDGPGLVQEMHGDGAFEPFATTKPAGTGLGLSIVQKIVSQHGGEIALANLATGGMEATLFISD